MRLGHAGVDRGLPTSSGRRASGSLVAGPHRGGGPDQLCLSLHLCTVVCFGGGRPASVCRGSPSGLAAPDLGLHEPVDDLLRTPYAGAGRAGGLLRLLSLAPPPLGAALGIDAARG